jgi:hypothetical protein
VGDKLEVSKLPKPTVPPDPAPSTTKGRGLCAPVLEIDMVSEPEPSGATIETVAEELK